MNAFVFEYMQKWFFFRFLRVDKDKTKKGAGMQGLISQQGDSSGLKTFRGESRIYNTGQLDQDFYKAQGKDGQVDQPQDRPKCDHFGGLLLWSWSEYGHFIQGNGNGDHTAYRHTHGSR